MDRIENVTARLEAVASRLEGAVHKSSSSSDVAVFVEPFKEIIAGPLAEFVKISNSVNTDVGQGATKLEKSFNETLNLLVLAAKFKKPSEDKLAILLKPLADSIDDIKKFANDKFKSDYKAHLESISSFCVAMGWISAPMKPQAFISEAIDSGMFYSNRVLTTFKEKGPLHKEWVASLVKLFKGLCQYAEDYHATGFSWNSKGGDAASAPAPTTAVAKIAAKPTAAPNPNELFSALNKGSEITSGLKKVADSEKTHKNPSLRVGATVSETATKASTTTAPAATQAANRPPVLELQGKKWMIENQKDQQMIEISEGDLSYCVNMYKCVNTNVKIPQKINTVTLDSCFNCKVQFESGLISMCDVINSKKIEIHADDKLPFINVNSTEGCQVYLNEKSLEAKVSTATSTSVNICTWSPNTDLVEYPVPYQFVSWIKDKKLVTEASDDI